jgi:hypothetical protein
VHVILVLFVAHGIVHTIGGGGEDETACGGIEMLSEDQNQDLLALAENGSVQHVGPLEVGLLNGRIAEYLRWLVDI